MANAGGDASLAPAASRGIEIAGLERPALRASSAENSPVAATVSTTPKIKGARLLRATATCGLGELSFKSSLSELVICHLA
jgi:hypothetical protein